MPHRLGGFFYSCLEMRNSQATDQHSGPAEARFDSCIGCFFQRLPALSKKLPTYQYAEVSAQRAWPTGDHVRCSCCAMYLRPCTQRALKGLGGVFQACAPSVV